jgi:signal transduction histidine kinase
VRGELAAAQEWTCGTCGRELVAGAATVVFATPSEGGPANRAPVLVDESCADEQRASFPNWSDAQETLGRAGDPAAADRALKAAVALHRDGLNAVVEQALAPLGAKIEGLETQSRELEKQKAELEQAVAGLRKNEQDLLAKTRTAFRQALEQRISNCIKAMEDKGFITGSDAIRIIVEHLQPKRE